MSEALSRKKKVRAAHRASVTRMTAQVHEMLRDTGEELDVPRLEQKRQALQVKAELLSKLDEEIVDMIEEESLDEEIELADIIREKIELAVIEIDGALGGARARRHPPPPVRRTSEFEPPLEPHDPVDRAQSEPGMTVTSVHPIGPQEHTHDDPEEPTPPTDPGHALMEQQTHSPRVKLPKLSLKRFNGDLTKWMSFWDTFQSAVHNNPTLTSVDKFNYLHSLLESLAAEAISGLTLTSANYEEAITILKRRFGNKQLIVNRHMDLLLHLDVVTSQHDTKGLRHLFDVVESNVRALKALGVPSESYGSLLASVLISKLPSELRLIISRELNEGEWDLDSMIRIVQREVEARERSAGVAPSAPRKPTGRPPPTALSLVADTSAQASCVYCEQPHPSVKCQVIKDPQARKQVLRTSGRCFVCLRRHHISRNCRSNIRCYNCHKRHHTSVCLKSSSKSESSGPAENAPMTDTHTTADRAVQAQATSTMYVDAHTPILLQTARVIVCDASQPGLKPSLEVRAILDLGSQRSYVTSRIHEALRLKKVRSESMVIKTFGSSEENRKICDIVEVRIITRGHQPMTLSAVVVPHICDAVRAQPIHVSMQLYEHISGLDLADKEDIKGELEIDMLIGADQYWRLATGRVLKGPSGPTAIETRLGWVLSGPVEGVEREDTETDLVTTCHTHSLRVDSSTEYEALDAGLRRFWELESLGILKNEPSVHERFNQQVSFKSGRYEVHLPWKESHSYLPDNYELCLKRLNGLLKRLSQDPQQLLQYDAVIRDQLRQGVVEMVADPDCHEGERVHYLPHHAVVRRDKPTTRMRIVYDASARTDGPSLNDCLYTGPNLGQTVLDILLRFRLHKIALIGDVEKAFLMISVAGSDRDALRFLWIRDVNGPLTDIVVMRFTRVVFGVSASPFLLNATIEHHIKKYVSTDKPFVEKFQRSIYVDDLTTGCLDVDSAYEFYLKSKVYLDEAGFNLRKFATNSSELRQRINSNEHVLCQKGDRVPPCATHPPGNDLTPTMDEVQVLGVRWNVISDQLIFDVSSVCHTMKGTKPSKRSVVSLATRFFDPLGVISPITIQFKLLFQRMCEAGVDWDEPLAGELLTEWELLISKLQHATPLLLRRHCIQVESDSVDYSLLGFCDASQKAYAAVVYLQSKTDAGTSTHFLCAKTRVAPTKRLTIPRLELLAALLLARLINAVAHALEHEVQLGCSVCHTDSQVALCWIRGLEREWKQFVQNRVLEIRELVPANSWRHCRGVLNPADIPSRGVSPEELVEKRELWLHGPTEVNPSESVAELDLSVIPEECLAEMRTKDRAKPTIILFSSGEPKTVVKCDDYSTLQRLLRVTAYVLKFVRCLKRSQNTGARPPCQADGMLTTEDIEEALTYWLRVAQSALPQKQQFGMWRHQFGLFEDDHGIWRCRGRLSNADLSADMRHPVLLDKDHILTQLIVSECHERVMHGGVKATLTELRSKYWIIRGRQLVKKFLFRCVICRRFQGKPYSPPESPPLPSFRVNEARPFSFTGVDFAGPLYVRASLSPTSRKVWLCLFTCCATRAVHLDLVPDMTAQAFIRSFKRFTSRRGFPLRVLSDNAKTFKAAARMVTATLKNPTVRRYLSDIQVKWSFNLERAPWWGGIFERMIQSTKRCLKKTIGQARLTYDELLTSVTEVEMILNSRPLSYVSSDDIEEPLTPSHLLVGYRVLSLPDPTVRDDTNPGNDVTQEDLTRRMKHLSKALDDFWRRWRAEYLLELREVHRRAQPPKGAAKLITVGDVVIVHDEGRPRGLWRLGRVEELIPGADQKVRGALVRVHSRGHSAVIRRPVQRLYPLEVTAGKETANTSAEGNHQGNLTANGTEADPLPTNYASEVSSKEATVGTPCQENLRPRRRAFLHAQDTVKAWISDMIAD